MAFDDDSLRTASTADNRAVKRKIRAYVKTLRLIRAILVPDRPMRRSACSESNGIIIVQLTCSGTLVWYGGPADATTVGVGV